MNKLLLLLVISASLCLGYDDCSVTPPHTYSSTVYNSTGSFVLQQCDIFYSYSGRYHLILQDDGNLVGYDDDGAYFWNSVTFGRTDRPFTLELQPDGNLVLYSHQGGNKVAYWNTGTQDPYTTKKFSLSMQDDRNIVLLDSDNTVRWSSSSGICGAIPRTLHGCVTTLGNGGFKFNKGDSLLSNDGNSRLLIQDNGNLVGAVGAGNPTFWSTGLANQSASGCPYMEFKLGVINLYNAQGALVWYSPTVSSSSSSYSLCMVDQYQSIVIYDANHVALWSSSGYMDCDGLDQDGYETGVLSDIANCGSCGSVCSTPVHSQPVCNNGVCGYTCTGGYFDCNRNRSDGCESNPNTDNNNCGGCGALCNGGGDPGVLGTCTNGVCVHTCRPGYYSCGGGCINLSGDVNHCGSCSNVCFVHPPYTHVSCSAGICMYS